MDNNFRSETYCITWTIILDQKRIVSHDNNIRSETYCITWTIILDQKPNEDGIHIQFIEMVAMLFHRKWFPYFSQIF